MTILEPGNQRARRNNGASIGTNKNIEIHKKPKVIHSQDHLPQQMYMRAYGLYVTK